MTLKHIILGSVLGLTATGAASVTRADDDVAAAISRCKALSGWEADVCIKNVMTGPPPATEAHRETVAQCMAQGSWTADQCEMRANQDFFYGYTTQLATIIPPRCGFVLNEEIFVQTLKGHGWTDRRSTSPSYDKGMRDAVARFEMDGDKGCSHIMEQYGPRGYRIHYLFMSGG